MPLPLLFAMAASLASPGPTARRLPGPAGSLVVVEESRAVPLISLIIAARSGSASDPRFKDGLTNLAAEAARRGAAGRRREEIDEALDAVGANLQVLVDRDSVRLSAQVLPRNLEALLAIVADIVLRPDFDEDEFARTRREILAQIDEQRNDDRALALRFFDRRLFGDHPYGRAPDGTEKTLARIRREEAAAHFREQFTGANVLFAAAGDVRAEAFAEKVKHAFASLRPGPARTPAVARPARPDGWRVQIVDKPGRQQTQIVLGHAGPPASDPDFLALHVALAAFGGPGMTATLMDEVRTKRGLAYGAYMGITPRRGPSAIAGWVFTAADKTVTTLKLVLRLYRRLPSQGLSPERVRFFQRYLAGVHAAEMDSPRRRLEARLEAEIQGLPEDWVDTYAERLKALSPDAVLAAARKHLQPDHLAITLVGTAARIEPPLVASKVDRGAIDVVAFDSY